jgi:hypothetical protein
MGQAAATPSRMIALQPSVFRSCVRGGSSPLVMAFLLCGDRISPDDATMEYMARYINRASFSQERMKCLDRRDVYQRPPF